ncbi:DsrE family protein [Desulfosediminicola flagellatus]|uniref:DsrE family protein n=1 Tax=Desulfosediminicola flagellatus TaxID=2569541 RepID=UPI0010ADA3D1|nr:DsrE family protein [Desulfosediminicola flagellatus]
MKSTFYTVIVSILVCMGIGMSTPAFSGQYNDTNALEGLTSAKTLFDINLKDAKSLELYLGVIKKTHEDIIRQGLKPEIVIAFRGATVRLINTETWSFSDEDQQSLARSTILLKELRDLGIRQEACSIATNLYKIDNSTILPGIHVVGNTFVSLTGYQGKGYALVPIQ